MSSVKDDFVHERTFRCATEGTDDEWVAMSSYVVNHPICVSIAIECVVVIEVSRGDVACSCLEDLLSLGTCADDAKVVTTEW